MGLVPVCALVANLAMPGTRWSDDLAVWAELAGGDLLHQLLEFKLRSLVLLNIARVASDTDDEGEKELDTDEGGRQHEVPHIQD